jgi:hypothetical protein
MSGCRNVIMPEVQDVRMPDCQDAKMSGCQQGCNGMVGYLGLRILGSSVRPENWLGWSRKWIFELSRKS